MWPKLQRGFCSSKSSREWGVKQVTKLNFGSILGEVRGLIRDADFIAVCSHKSGLYASPWHRVLPIDTPDTAYFKAKHAAEKFEIFQFSVCPFRFDGTKVVAFPYNFHLFPRDELNVGMPSYSFSCQISCLTAMARENFDFNTCIYDGITYLSRVQESLSKHRIAHFLPVDNFLSSSHNHTVADSLFVERTRYRVAHWRDSCKDSSHFRDEALVRSLRKLILGGELFGSRPCISVDVCNERQTRLVLEMLSKLSGDLVPLVVPDKAGEPATVRVILTSSNEDKALLMDELKSLEDEQNMKIRGFRAVIDAISESCKPVVGYNCLNDFAFVHSKFIAPLPPTLSEFMCSLRFAFPNILDISHLLKEIPSLKKSNNLHDALSYLKRQFFLPIEMEVPHAAEEVADEKNLGHNVVRITHLFAKLCSLLKICPACQSSNENGKASLESYTNVFYPCRANLQETVEGDVWMDCENQVNKGNLVLLWGFGRLLSDKALKKQLSDIHSAFGEGFDVHLLDSSCAAVAFWNVDSAKRFIRDINSSLDMFPVLHELVSEGLKATTYREYELVCDMGFWDLDMAESLDRVQSEFIESVCMNGEPSRSHASLSAQ